MMTPGHTELTHQQRQFIGGIREVGNELDEMIAEARAVPELCDPRWLAIAETHLQQGLMALARAIAKPDFF